MFLQLHEGEYHDLVDHLRERGFGGACLGLPTRRFMSKPQLLAQYIHGVGRLVLKFRSLREVRTLFVFGRFGFAAKLLARVGLLRYKRSFCFGFFVQEPRLFSFFGGWRG